MGNSVLIRREGEISHLQPHLGDTKRQQLRSSPFTPTPLFHPQLVKDGEEFFLKTKRHPKTTQNQPFCGPSTTRKEAPTGNVSMGDNPQAVTNRFPQVTRVVFDPTAGAEGVVTLLPNDYLTSTNPPVGGYLHSFRRDWLKEKCSNNMLNIITNGYVLSFRMKTKLARFPLILSGYKDHPKDLALASCIQSLPNKNTRERVENTKSPVSSPQAQQKNGNRS